MAVKWYTFLDPYIPSTMTRKNRQECQRVGLLSAQGAISSYAGRADYSAEQGKTDAFPGTGHPQYWRVEAGSRVKTLGFPQRDANGRYKVKALSVESTYSDPSWNIYGTSLGSGSGIYRSFGNYFDAWAKRAGYSGGLVLLETRAIKPSDYEISMTEGSIEFPGKPIPTPYPLFELLEDDTVTYPRNMAPRINPQTGALEFADYQQLYKALSAGEFSADLSEVGGTDTSVPGMQIGELYPMVTDGKPTEGQIGFAKSLVKFAQANGVKVATTLRVGSYTAAPGYVPQAQLDWHHDNGSVVHTSGINVLMAGGDQVFNNEVRAVRHALNIPNADMLTVNSANFKG